MFQRYDCVYKPLLYYTFCVRMYIWCYLVALYKSHQRNQMSFLFTHFQTVSLNEKPNLLFLHPSPDFTCSCHSHRCYVDDKVSRVAWLNRSNIIFAGQDKWSLDPRVDLVTKGQLEYSLRIQKVTLTIEGNNWSGLYNNTFSKFHSSWAVVRWQLPDMLGKTN